MADKNETLRKLREEFRKAGAREVQLRTIGSVTALVLSIIVLMMVLGDPLGLMALLGFESAERRGAYGDCSDPRNRDSKLCDRTVQESDRQWKSLRKTHGDNAPFSLDNR